MKYAYTFIRQVYVMFPSRNERILTSRNENAD